MALFEVSQLLLFVGASVALVLVPGPAVAVLVTRSLTEGIDVGVKTAAGIALGNLCHALAASFGLAAFLVSYPPAYQAIRYAGAAYLIYLGIKVWLAKPARDEPQELNKKRNVFREGILVGALNPKVALFLLAFLPQFSNPEAGPLWLQFLVLGVLFVVIGWIGDTTWALASGWIGGRIRRTGPSKWGRFVSCGVYLLLGVSTFLWKG